jgi:preprotein translocase subunit SecE
MKSAVQFLHEVKGELSKVAWPKLDELIGSTIIVLVLVTIFAIYLGVLDFGLSQLAQYIFKTYSL